MKHLGDLYYQGPSGNDKNVAAALPWWQEAADHGERTVACKVGCAYLNGENCTHNEKLALHYFLMATAFTTDAEPKYFVGYCYENGIGCHINKRKAISYYEQAALKGHPEAQWRLGALLSIMRKPDGLYWICCAHLAGVKEASDAVRYNMTNGYAELVNNEIRQIKRNGPKQYGSNYEYNRELSIFLSVLKWLVVGFLVSMISAVIICGFILEMEHFPTLFIILIIGLFGYLGYWIEDN